MVLAKGAIPSKRLLNAGVGGVTLAFGHDMLGRRSSGGRVMRTFAASSTTYVGAVALCLLGWLLGGDVLGVVQVMSASAGQSVFPGRNGKITLIQTCLGGSQGGPEATSCGKRFAAMSADGSSFHLLRQSDAYEFVWAPDGRRVLINGGRAIRVLRPEGGKVTTIFRLKPSQSELRLFGASWFPDGKRIAFTQVQKLRSNRTTLYTIGVDGTRLHKIRVFPSALDGLSVSPDGHRIAFARGAITPTIYIMNSDGSGLRKLLSRCHLSINDWSPDSKRLLVSWYEQVGIYCEGPEKGLYIVPVKGGAATRVFNEPYVDTGPGTAYGSNAPQGEFSPDGTRIAFIVQREPSYAALSNTVLVMNANGTGVRTVRQGLTHYVYDPNGQSECSPCTYYSSLTWQPLRR